MGDEGGLDHCNVLTEEPRSSGFGASARTLASRFRVGTLASDGQSLVGMKVHVPVTFPVEALNGGAPVVGAPHWARSPQAGIPGAGYPVAARDAGVTDGRASVSCIVQPGGGLADCRVVSETPPGLGFGAAALAMSQGFVMTQWTDDGLSTIGASVRVPVHFRLPTPEPAAPAAAAPAAP